jgi:hypothetical protein
VKPLNGTDLFRMRVTPPPQFERDVELDTLYSLVKCVVFSRASFSSGALPRFSYVGLFMSLIQWSTFLPLYPLRLHVHWYRGKFCEYEKTGKLSFLPLFEVPSFMSLCSRIRNFITNMKPIISHNPEQLMSSFSVLTAYFLWIHLIHIPLHLLVPNGFAM